MLFSKKNKVLSDDAKESVKDLRLEITYKLKCEGGYKEPEVARLEITKQLVTNSDSPVKDILKEIESLSDGAHGEFVDVIGNSRHLSDGFHAEKNQD